MPTIQRVATVALRRQLQELGGTRARDGAVVVLDNASGDVLAYVGGIGGASTAPAVDAAGAYRQAGSTLKPFLYAQAIERGYLTPASILDDSPVQLDTASGLYVPQNYDRAFKGPVSARVALAGSLNVPAVRTLLLVGVDPFRDRLWDTGYRGMTEDGQYYGFSLALGSAEVTLLEQAAAYRSLALGGRWSPPRLTVDAPRIAPRRVTTPQAAWLVSDMIADAGARAGTFGLDSALRLPFWAAVKTGTSKAMRDNWCVGFSDRYTVAVWIGNMEGDPMRAVSGTSGAAPVWRDVMLALGPGKPIADAGRDRGAAGPRADRAGAPRILPGRNRASGDGGGARQRAAAQDRQPGRRQRLCARPRHPARPPAAGGRRDRAGRRAPAGARPARSGAGRQRAATAGGAGPAHAAADRCRWPHRRSGALHRTLAKRAQDPLARPCVARAGPFPLSGPVPPSGTGRAAAYHAARPNGSSVELRPVVGVGRIAAAAAAQARRADRTDIAEQLLRRSCACGPASA